MKNRPMTFCAVGLLAGLAGLSVAGARAAEGDHFSLGAGFEYSTGNFGAASSTSILSIPVVGSYATDLWAFKLTVPYVRISGTGGVLPDGRRVKAATSNKKSTQSGLGDVIAAATRNIYSGSESNTRADLTGKIKFATAGTNLGTGRNDYAVQADVYRGLDRFTAMGALGYEVLGSPAGVSMNNVAYGILGGFYRLTEQTGGGAEMRISRKPSAIGEGQRELTLYLNHGSGEGLNIRGYVLKGFSDGSPDSGFGMMVSSDL